MNIPLLISKDSFQEAWIAATQHLLENGDLYNLVVSISNPTLVDTSLDLRVTDFAKNNNLKTPKVVAYTIFPHKLYKTHRNAESLFEAYNRPTGLYKRLKKKRPPNDWGTYFGRLTNYESASGQVNQLRNIINAINDRAHSYKAAYTMIIQQPGNESIRPLGGPCLNYLAVQLEPTTKKLGLLAVYRNHDFFERAYGNYCGLCKLICFIAEETNFNAGQLTCISSHAFINGSHRI